GTDEQASRTLQERRARPSIPKAGPAVRVAGTRGTLEPAAPALGRRRARNHGGLGHEKDLPGDDGQSPGVPTSRWKQPSRSTHRETVDRQTPGAGSGSGSTGAGLPPRQEQKLIGHRNPLHDKRLAQTQRREAVRALAQVQSCQQQTEGTDQRDTWAPRRRLKPQLTSFAEKKHEEKAQGLLDDALKQTIYLLVGGVPVWSSKSYTKNANASNSNEFNIIQKKQRRKLERSICFVQMHVVKQSLTEAVRIHDTRIWHGSPESSSASQPKQTRQRPAPARRRACGHLPGSDGYSVPRAINAAKQDRVRVARVPASIRGSVRGLAWGLGFGASAGVQGGCQRGPLSALGTQSASRCTCPAARAALGPGTGSSPPTAAAPGNRNYSVPTHTTRRLTRPGQEGPQDRTSVGAVHGCGEEALARGSPTTPACEGTFRCAFGGQKLIFQKEEELANSLKEKNQSEEGQKEKLRKEALGKRQERLEKEAHVGNAAFVMGHGLSWDMGSRHSQMWVHTGYHAEHTVYTGNVQLATAPGDREEIRKEQVLRSYHVSICLVKAPHSEHVHMLETRVRTLTGEKYKNHHDVIKRHVPALRELGRFRLTCSPASWHLPVGQSRTAAGDSDRCTFTTAQTLGAKFGYGIRARPPLDDLVASTVRMSCFPTGQWASGLHAEHPLGAARFTFRESPRWVRGGPGQSRLPDSMATRCPDRRAAPSAIGGDAAVGPRPGSGRLPGITWPTTVMIKLEGETPAACPQVSAPVGAMPVLPKELSPSCTEVSARSPSSAQLCPRGRLFSTSRVVFIISDPADIRIPPLSEGFRGFETPGDIRLVHAESPGPDGGFALEMKTGLKQGLSKRSQMKTIFNFLEGQSGSLKKNLVLIIEGIKGRGRLATALGFKRGGLSPGLLTQPPRSGPRTDPRSRTERGEKRTGKKAHLGRHIVPGRDQQMPEIKAGSVSSEGRAVEAASPENSSKTTWFPEAPEAAAALEEREQFRLVGFSVTVGDSVHVRFASGTESDVWLRDFWTCGDMDSVATRPASTSAGECSPRCRSLFVLETVCVAWFSFEFLLRSLQAESKCAFLRTPLNIIDILAILPFYVSLLLRGDLPGSLLTCSPLKTPGKAEGLHVSRPHSCPRAPRPPPPPGVTALLLWRREDSPLARRSSASTAGRPGRNRFLLRGGEPRRFSLQGFGALRDQRPPRVTGWGARRPSCWEPRGCGEGRSARRWLGRAVSPPPPRPPDTVPPAALWQALLAVASVAHLGWGPGSGQVPAGLLPHTRQGNPDWRHPCGTALCVSCKTWPEN
ncbi:hypothetical protein E2I00_004345, partial [Balaenoptera physalus]